VSSFERPLREHLNADIVEIHRHGHHMQTKGRTVQSLMIASRGRSPPLPSSPTISQRSFGPKQHDHKHQGNHAPSVALFASCVPAAQSIHVLVQQHVRAFLLRSCQQQVVCACAHRLAGGVALAVSSTCGDIFSTVIHLVTTPTSRRVPTSGVGVCGLKLCCP
jgi:hypothetical protein